MNNKHVLVTLKYYKGELNPFDCAALECALCSGAKVSVLAMAPLGVKENLENLTRLNLDAYLVTDTVYAGGDTLATSLVLSEAIKKINPDVIFCGRQSIDGDTAQVPPMLAERLNYNFVSKIIKISGDNYTTRSGVTGKFLDKTIFTFERINALRFPSIFSKKREITIWDNSHLKLDASMVGLKGSPTQVTKTYESSVGRRFCKFITVDELPNLIANQLKIERASNFVSSNNEKIDKLYYFGNIKDVANSIASNAIEVDYSNKTAEEVAKYLVDNGATTVLFSDNDDLKILAAKLSVLTNSGLCADCISLRVEKGKVVMTRPAQGGSITADIICKSEMTLATVRTMEKDSRELIFSLGRGAINHLETLKSYAQKYNAEVCASRAVVDMGKMPYETQVGLTGRIVAPKVYVAFGIAGAVQHTTAISGAGTIIAINNDKNARIFDYADYGVLANVEELKL